jgi:hypothetical protein
MASDYDKSFAAALGGDIRGARDAGETPAVTSARVQVERAEAELDRQLEGLCYLGELRNAWDAWKAATGDFEEAASRAA